jgi:hypothetical protein
MRINPGFARIAIVVIVLGVVVAIGVLVTRRTPNRLAPPTPTVVEITRRNYVLFATPTSDITIRHIANGCFGTCPVFTLILEADNGSGDGKVSFDGLYYTCILGPATGTISRKKVDALVGEVREIGFFEMDGRYEPDVTDGPEYVTVISLNGQSNIVSHSLDPLELVRFERALIESTDADTWIDPGCNDNELTK